MVNEIRRRIPSAITATGDCQKTIPLKNNYSIDGATLFAFSRRLSSL
jgi:hypothetical protein